MTTTALWSGPGKRVHVVLAPRLRSMPLEGSNTSRPYRPESRHHGRALAERFLEHPRAHGHERLARGALTLVVGARTVEEFVVYGERDGTLTLAVATDCLGRLATLGALTN